MRRVDSENIYLRVIGTLKAYVPVACLVSRELFFSLQLHSSTSNVQVDYCSSQTTGKLNIVVVFYRENYEHTRDKGSGNYTTDFHGGQLHLQGLHGSDKSYVPESKKINQSGVSTDQCSTAKDKQALGEIIYSLIKDQHPDSAEELTGILLEMDFQSLENLIKDADLLESKVSEVLVALQNASEEMQNGQIEVVPKQHCHKLVIGEELYGLVSAINVEHTEKITGMLLEMDTQQLEVIVKDQVALEEKVNQALKALNNQREMPEGTSLAEQESDKTQLGEKLYHMITEWYPDQADKITGMFLELDVTTLRLLLQDSVTLKEKASDAVHALSETTFENEIPLVLQGGKKIPDSRTGHSLAKQLYNVINKWYPDTAEKLTEMVVESNKDCSILESLVLNEQLLKEKIDAMLDEEHKSETALSHR